MNTDQKYKLLSMMGYKGPKDESLMSSFIESNPAAGSKFGQFLSASKGFNQGGMVKGYASGGYVMGPNNQIMKSDGTLYKKYSSLSEAYKALTELNQPKTAPTTATQNNVWVPDSKGSNAEYTVQANGSTQTTNPAVTNQLSQSQLNSIFQSTLGRQVRSFEVPQYQNMSAAQVKQALASKYSVQVPTTPQPNTTPTPTSPNGTQNYSTQVNSLYNQYLNRDAQKAGLDFYTGLLQKGVPLSKIEADIKKNAVTENTVRQAYADTGLQVDQAGLEFYTGLLNSGKINVDQMRADIRRNTQTSGSTSGTQTSGPSVNNPSGDWINDLYQEVYGRPVDQAGKDWIQGKINRGEWTQEAASQWVRSQGGSGTTFQPKSQEEAQALTEFTNLYRNIFGRNPDQEGLDFWMNAVSSGSVTLEEALNQIIKSKEAQLIDTQKWEEAQALRSAQQRFMSSAYQAPQDLVTGQEVAQLQATDGTLIPTNVGQVTGTPGYQASTIDPSTGQAQAPANIDTATFDAQTITQDLKDTLGDLEAQAATPTAMATVKGQLEVLMDDFEDGTPPWASGAMRKAMGIMQQRGLGASSIAGMAVVQAAMESATAIAQQDANTYATFELRNLDNRQQTAIFKAQQRISGLFTDQAAVNASRQFNASSENQTNQFMASLQESVSRFNAAQVAAIAEININAENSAKQFNSTLQDLRDRFNATNGLVIAQANAQWRQNINTINTAEQNDANSDYVKTVNGITTASLDQLWQRERDLMSFAYGASESGLERQLQLMLADRQEDLVKWQQDREEDAAKGYVFTRLASDVLFGGGGGEGLLGGLF